jgi:hypothetical protein
VVILILYDPLVADFGFDPYLSPIYFTDRCRALAWDLLGKWMKDYDPPQPIPIP